MFEYFIPLLASYIPMFDYVLWMVFALAFLVSVPRIIAVIIRWR